MCERCPIVLNVASAPVSRPAARVVHHHISDSSHLGSINVGGFNQPNGLTFPWAWRRQPTTSPEIDELINLVSLLSQLQLSEEDDHWECTIDQSRVFSVKGMRTLITSHL